MHAIKGGWVGQTFALANSVDSDPGGGKKSRTRRSKAERKGMVESFIKKYQKSNNGNFPSLNLTHKEVGGSFYTVREIVREIIQENRVLGPAKVELLVEEKNDQFLEQNPLGSIAVEPQSSVSDALHEMVLETSLSPSKQLPDGNLNREEQLVNGLVVEVLEDGVGGLYLDSKGVDGSVETARGLGHSAAIASTLVNVADVEVETFPTSTLGEVEQGAASEMVTVNGTSLEKISVSGSESSFDSDLLPQLSLVEDQSSVDYEAMAEKTPLSVEAEAHEVAVESSSATLVEVSEGKDLSINSTGAVTTRARDSQRSADAGKHNGNNTTVDGEKPLQRENMKPGHDIRSNSKGSFQAGSTPPLDRINLESWKVASKDSSMPGKNPLLAILKALVDSFVKFWTEE